MTATLIRDDTGWRYRGFDGPATRRLRVWRIGPGRLVAMVTQQPGDMGTSITNAAEAVVSQLVDEHPHETVEIVEHYTPDGHSAETFDLVTLDDQGQASWRPLGADGLHARFGLSLRD